MYSPLPQTSEAFERSSWSEIEPWYRELLATRLTTETLQPWLLQWSHLSELVDETMMWLEIITTQNTADEERAERRRRFLGEIFVHVQALDQQIKQQLLDSGLQAEGFAIPLRNLRAEANLYRESNLALLNREKELSERYMSINGAQTVQWDDKELPIVSLFPFMQDPDREIRERAWHTRTERKFEDREALNGVWSQLLQLRLQIARNAGLGSYRDYRWQQLLRFDYTPADCKAFHEAVEQVIVPITIQLAQKRCQMLGVETLRPWDLYVDPRSNKAPRAIKDVNALLLQLADMFRGIDPALGDYFDTMIREQCFDLEERTNKAPGGYNLPLEVRHLPFIFGYVMTITDIQALVCHEAGHAFHVFETKHLPYIHQRKEHAIPIEFAEVASTSMEFIGGMHLASSGTCTQEEARIMRLQHLESILFALPQMMQGDALQHWIYENPEQALDAEAVSQKWAELGKRFQPYIDWSGLEAAHRYDWQSILHFFDVPFYYIEYAFATIGALQVWRNYQRDPQSALGQYRHALSLGATRPLPELYAAAGAKFAADATTLQEVTQLVTDAMETLEKEA